MANDNVTVDELSLEISANADKASASLKELGTTLNALAASLGDVMPQLAAVDSLLRAAKGAGPALSAAMGQASAGVRKSAVEMGTSTAQVQHQFATLIQTFDTLKNNFASGSMSADAAIKQMSTAASQANSTLLNLKKTSHDLIPAAEFRRMDGEFAGMINDVNRLKSAIKGVNLSKLSFGGFGGSFPTAPKMPSFTDATAALTTGASSSVRVATSESRRLSDVLKTVKDRVTGVTQSLSNMGRAGRKHTNLLGNSFVQLRSKIFFVLFAVGLLSKAFQTFLANASGATESAHLFAVAFGEMSEEAASWVQNVSGRLGLDPVQFSRTAATFMDMARSMNLTNREAMTLSQNLTQLSYDYASLYDQPFAQTAEKFQSALAGQTRAVRQYGLDITQASLQEEIYAEGLDYKISQLNRASKAVLIHNRLMRQSVRTQGDLAKTIYQPANMMRIFADMARVAARSIGYLFMPLLKAVLPWLIYFAQAVSNASVALGRFFGINVPTWKDMLAEFRGMDLGSVSDDMDDIYANVDNAATAAKKLKDYVLGIDELNILSPDTSDALDNLGSGVAPGIKPFDVYDMVGGVDALDTIISPIQKKLQPLIDKFREFWDNIKPFRDALSRLWEAFKPFASNVWKGFTGWINDTLLPLIEGAFNTVGVMLIEGLTAALNWFNKNPEVAEAIGRVAGALGLLWLAFKLGPAAAVGLGVLVGVELDRILREHIPNYQEKWNEFLKGDWVEEKMPATTHWLGSVMLMVNGEMDTLISEVQAKHPILTDALGSLYLLFSGDMDVLISEFKLQWQESMGWWGQRLGDAKGWASDTWESMKKSASEKWGSMATTIGTKIDAITKKFDDLKQRGADLKASWGRFWSDLGTTFKNGINDLIKKINTGFLPMVNKFLTTIRDLPDFPGKPRVPQEIRDIPELARGGSVSVGSVFMAGEAGPELVGQFGGNPNTVMPLKDSGFVEAMYSAVFNAVMSAATQSGGGGGGDIYMDGQKVGEVLDKSKRRTGVGMSLVKSGVG